MEPKRRIIEERYCFDVEGLLTLLEITGDLEKVELHAGGNGNEVQFCTKRVVA